MDRVPELLMVITPALRPVRQSSPIIDPDPKALYEIDSPILIGAGRDKRQIAPTRRPKRRSKDSKNCSTRKVRLGTKLVGKRPTNRLSRLLIEDRITFGIRRDCSCRAILVGPDARVVPGTCSPAAQGR